MSSRVRKIEGKKEMEKEKERETKGSRLRERGTKRERERYKERERERERVVSWMQQPKLIALTYLVGHKQEKSLNKTQILQHYYIIIDNVPKLFSASRLTIFKKLTLAKSKKNISLSI